MASLAPALFLFLPLQNGVGETLLFEIRDVGGLLGREARRQFRVQELLRARRPRDVRTLGRTGFALVRVVAWEIVISWVSISAARRREMGNGTNRIAGTSDTVS